MNFKSSLYNFNSINCDILYFFWVGSNISHIICFTKENIDIKTTSILYIVTLHIQSLGDEVFFVFVV